MTGLEFAVGLLAAWVIKKARHVGKQVDAEVDHALDLGLDRLHRLVADKLGNDTALIKLHEEAARTGQVSDGTRYRVQAAIEDISVANPQFDMELKALIDQLIALKGGIGQRIGGFNVGGNLSVRTQDHGFAVVGHTQSITVNSLSTEEC